MALLFTPEDCSHTPGNYSYTGIFLNNQFSHNCSNSSRLLAWPLGDAIQPFTKNSYKIAYDYLNDWIYTSDVHSASFLRTNWNGSLANEFNLEPCVNGSKFLDWTLSVDVQAIFYLVTDSPATYACVYQQDTPGDQLFMNFFYPTFPKLVSYDPVSSYIYVAGANDDNTLGIVRLYTPTEEGIVQLENVTTLLPETVSCLDPSLNLLGNLFVYNGTILFAVSCSNPDSVTFLRYSVMNSELSTIYSEELENSSSITLTAVSWETSMLLWSYRNATYSISYEIAAITEPALCSPALVGPVYFFPSSQSIEEIKSLHSCSMAGTFTNETCRCDAGYFGEDCSAYYCSGRFCTCEPGYHLTNPLFTNCSANGVPLMYPADYFSSVVLFNGRLNETFSLDYYYSANQTATKYSSTENENEFVLDNYSSRTQLQGNGVSCSTIPLPENATFPLYFMPENSLLILPNYTYNGIPSQFWQTPDGLVTTITTTFQGTAVPLFIENAIDHTQIQFNLSTTALSFSDYGWITNNSLCGDCLNSANDCVSSTPTLFSPPSMTPTATATPTPSSSFSFSPTRTPSISFSSSTSSSITPSPYITPSTKDANWDIILLSICAALLFLLVLGLCISLGAFVYSKLKRKRKVEEKETLLGETPY